MGHKTTIALLASIAMTAVTADFGLANSSPPLPPMPNPPPLPSQMPPALPQQPPQAQENPQGPATMGVLAPYVQMGSSPPWDATSDGNTYTLTNTTDSNTVRYFYLTRSDTTTKAKVSVMVTISPQQGETAGAGLIYSYNPTTQAYLAVTLQADNTVAIYGHDQSGFNEMMRTSSDGLLKHGANELTIIGEGNSAEIFVNGQSMSKISNDLISTQSGAGVLVLGRGTYSFSNYVHEPAQ